MYNNELNNSKAARQEGARTYSAFWPKMILLFLAAILCFQDLGERAYWFDNGEPHTSVTARRLLEEGLTGTYFSNFPERVMPMGPFSIAASYYLTGASDELASRLPSTMWAAGTLFLVYLIGVRLAGPWAGLISSGCLLTSILFNLSSRSAGTEASSLFFFTACVLFLVYWRDSFRALWMRLFWACMGFLFYSGGLVMVAMFAGSLAYWLYANKREGRAWRQALDPFGLVLFMLITAPWIFSAFLFQGVPFTHESAALLVSLETLAGQIILCFPWLIMAPEVFISNREKVGSEPWPLLSFFSGLLAMVFILALMGWPHLHPALIILSLLIGRLAPESEPSSIQAPNVHGFWRRLRFVNLVTLFPLAPLLLFLYGFYWTAMLPIPPLEDTIVLLAGIYIVSKYSSNLVNRGQSWGMWPAAGLSAFMFLSYLNGILPAADRSFSHKVFYWQTSQIAERMDDVLFFGHATHQARYYLKRNRLQRVETKEDINKAFIAARTGHREVFIITDQEHKGFLEAILKSFPDKVEYMKDSYFIPPWKSLERQILYLYIVKRENRLQQLI